MILLVPLSKSILEMNWFWYFKEVVTDIESMFLWGLNLTSLRFSYHIWRNCNLDFLILFNTGWSSTLSRISTSKDIYIIYFLIYEFKKYHFEIIETLWPLMMISAKLRIWSIFEISFNQLQAMACIKHYPHLFHPVAELYYFV